MNKKILMPIVFIALLSLAIFVSASISTDMDTESNYIIEVNINKGWNLVLATPIDNGKNYIAEGSDIKLGDIEASFIYSRVSNSYTQLYPYKNTNEENSYYKVGQESAYYLVQSPVWIYSKKSGTLRYFKYEDTMPRLEDYSKIVFKKGWNFVGITSPFVDKTLQDFKGTCNIEKSYFFSDRENPSGSWMIFPLDVKFLNRDSAGGGILIKVSSDCNFGSVVNSNVNPPSLPSGGSSSTNTCIDSDGGIVIDVRGSISHDGGVSEDYCKDSYILGERYCENNLKGTSFVDCSDSGFSRCENGRCI